MPKQTPSKTPESSSKKAGGSSPAPAVKRRVAPPQEERSIKKLMLIYLPIILILALVWGIVYTVTSSKDTPKTPTAPASSTSVTQTVRSVTGKSLEEDKKDAVKALTAIIQTADKSPTGVDAPARLQALEKDDYSVIDSTLPSHLHFGPDSTQGMKTSTYQSLVTLATVTKDRNANKKIEPSDDAWKKAYGDPQLGTVFVPLSIYAANSNAAFSLEMVYVDDEWKLSPYSLLDAIRLSAALQASAPK